MPGQLRKNKKIKIGELAAPCPAGADRAAVADLAPGYDRRTGAAQAHDPRSGGKRQLVTAEHFNTTKKNLTKNAIRVRICHRIQKMSFIFTITTRNA